MRALFPSPVSPPVRGLGHVRPWLSTVWSFSGSCFPVVPSLGLGTTPTDPSPHLAPSGLHTQVLLLVASQLPGTSSLIPIPSAPCWAVFFWAVTFPLAVLRQARKSNDSSHSHGQELSLAWEKPLFWRLPGSGIGLAWCGARASGAHMPLLRGGGRFAAFPWISQSGLTFGFPSQLTVSKQHKMC